MKKKILLLVFTLLSTMTASAYDAQINGIYYNLDEYAKTATVVSGNTKYTGSVTIPATVTLSNVTYSVTSIGYYAFENCPDLTSVTIGNSVTEIGAMAFYGCSSLNSITIPNSVISIGMYAFYGTAWYNNKPDGLVYAGLVAYKYKGTMPENTFITIKEGTLGIAEYAFESCSGLTWVSIPISVTEISSSAFEGCRSLTSLTIPSNVTSIGSRAFQGCSSLTSITIPNSVTSIGFYAFYGCSGLASIEIPNSLASIGYSAFYGTAWYNNQPDGLIYIGKVLYEYKGTMPFNTSITIEEGTLGIAGSAFSGRISLKSVTIPNSVTSIGESAFNGTGLTSIIIPNSVTSIGQLTFFNCPDLTSIVVSNGNTTYDSRNNCNAIIKTATNTLVMGCKNTTIPNSVTSIGDAFYGCSGLTSIEIPNSVTSIGSSAFSGCSGLTSIEIPNSVTSIGSSAFTDCSRLSRVYCYAENVPTTSSSAFQGVTLNSAKLYVLDSSKDDYSASAPWSSFGTIESLKANATLGTNGFTTFAYRYPLDLSNAKLPTGVKAYKASSISGTTVYFTEFDQTVPANTGILLEGPANETVGILVAASGTDVASNEFRVNETGETFAAEPGYTYYALIKNSDPLTFGTFAPASVAMPSNKAYLMVAGGGNSARSMRTVFGSSITGLNETKSALDTTVKNGAYLEKGRIVIYKAGNKFNATGAQIK